jgi:hypothetical protein
MRRSLAWLAGAVGIAGAAAYRALRRQGAVAEPVEDPRAAELRRKLHESRELVEEREEFESAETTVDAAEPAPAEVEDRVSMSPEPAPAAAETTVDAVEPAPPEVEGRRGAVHERGRAAAEKMRGRSGRG